MNERYRSFKVKSYSSGTFGRAISNVRNHHFVTDDVGCLVAMRSDRLNTSFLVSRPVPLTWWRR